MNEVEVEWKSIGKPEIPKVPEIPEIKENEPLVRSRIGRMGIRKRIFRDYPQAYQRIMQMLVNQTHTLDEIQKETKTLTGYTISKQTLVKWRRYARSKLYPSSKS